MNTIQTQLHPLTGTDYRAPLYISSTGRKFYPIGGGSEDGGDAGAGADAAAAEAQAAADKAAADKTAADEAAAKAAGAAGGTEWDGKIESLDPKVQKMIADLRTENASTRTTAKEQAAKEAREAVIKEVGKQLGLIEDGKAPTAEELMAQLTEKDASNKTLTSDHTSLQREHQVLLSAIEAGADHQALLDSRSFLAKVADLDPAGDKFVDEVKAAVEAALKDNPKLKATQVVGKGGSEFTGGSGEGAGKAKTLEEAIASRMATT